MKNKITVGSSKKSKTGKYSSSRLNKASMKRFRALRSKVLPFAETAGYLTDDDVFKSMK